MNWRRFYILVVPLTLKNNTFYISPLETYTSGSYPPFISLNSAHCEVSQVTGKHFCYNIVTNQCQPWSSGSSLCRVPGPLRPSRSNGDKRTSQFITVSYDRLNFLIMELLYTQLFSLNEYYFISPESLSSFSSYMHFKKLQNLRMVY